MLKIEDFTKHKFKYLYHNKDLNYDVFDKKTYDVKIILLWGESEGHFFNIPTTWIVRRNLTVFKGKIETLEQLELVLKMMEL